MTSSGKRVFDTEKAILDHILPKLFGYHIVQLGELPYDVLASSTIANHFVLSVTDRNVRQTVNHEEYSSRCSQYQLPIESASVDVVTLHHILEYSADCHQVMREVQRVLIGEGHVIIVGFNPWSLWGLGQIIFRWRWRRPPWGGRFIGTWRIKDWLSLLGFDVMETRYVLFNPPIQYEKIAKKLLFLEVIGKYCPIFCGVYVLLAKKRVLPFTPIKMQWHAHRPFVASGLAGPSR